MAAKIEDVTLEEVAPEVAKKRDEMRRDFLVDLLQDSLGMLVGPVATAAKILKPYSIGRFAGQIAKRAKPATAQGMNQLMELLRVPQKEFSRLRALEFSPKLYFGGEEARGLAHLADNPKGLAIELSNTARPETIWHEFTHIRQKDIDDFLRGLTEELEKKWTHLPAEEFYTYDPTEVHARMLANEILKRPWSRRGASFESLYRRTKGETIKQTKSWFEPGEWDKLVSEMGKKK